MNDQHTAEEAESGTPRPLIYDHDFRPVAGHPDDDECTHRDDGTDATYCGEPEALHVAFDPDPEIVVWGRREAADERREQKELRDRIRENNQRIREQQRQPRR